MRYALFIVDDAVFLIAVLEIFYSSFIDKEKAMTKHQSLLDTSNKLFAILTKELNVNTVYIARRDEKVMTVINARNEDRTIVTPSMQVSYDDSNCRYVHENPSGTRSFKNLMTDSETKDRPITEQLQVKTFLGITIQRMNGVPFGTLCIMDLKKRRLPMIRSPLSNRLLTCCLT